MRPPRWLSQILIMESQGNQFVAHSLVTLGLTLLLTAISLWRLVVFIRALLRTGRRKNSRLSSGSGQASPISPTCSSRICCGGRTRGSSAGPSESSSLVGTPSMLDTRLPQLLLRKCVFHIVIFMGVAAEVPIWSYFHAKALAGVDPFTLSLPSGLYLLHLISALLLTISLGFVLDLWLTVVEFEPHHLIRCWHICSGLIFIPYIAFLGVVVANGLWSTKAASTLATNPTTISYNYFTASALVFLCALFAVAGTMIQVRIIKVFGSGGGGGGHHHRFTCTSLAVRLRVSLVMLTCLAGFLFRALDQAYPPQLPNPTDTSGVSIYLSILVGCNQPWYLSPCFLRWLAQLLPVPALLYIMRVTGDTTSRKEDEDDWRHHHHSNGSSGGYSRSSSEEDGLMDHHHHHHSPTSKAYNSMGSTASGGGSGRGRVLAPTISV